MARARTWTVEITITEHEDGRRTFANAVVRGVRPFPYAVGDAGLGPSGRQAPEIGDEPVSARALADLAYQVLDATEGRIEQVTRRPMRLLS